MAPEVCYRIHSFIHVRSKLFSCLLWHVHHHNFRS
jgi:hypothetical protein